MEINTVALTRFMAVHRVNQKYSMSPIRKKRDSKYR